MFRSLTQNLETALSTLSSALLVGPLVIASVIFLTTSL